jgi:signal transduction histidine kinase
MSSPRHLVPSAPISGDHGVVWVVDDSPLEVEAARRMLAVHHEVETFDNGPAVLERLAAGAGPDLLVLDWHMPDMSGIDVCRFLRNRFDEVMLPILVLTSTGGQADVVEGLRAGANDFVTKLADPAELVARVRGLVRARLLHDRLRRAELAAHRARLAAEEANRAKDAFMATVSHELRTPLSSILGWAHLLKENALDEATLRRGIESIERNAKIQVQLIEDILDTTRVVSGKLHLELAPMNFADVVRAAIDSLKPAADAKGVEVSLVVAEGPLVVHGDADRLQQAVWNLLSNAVKFTPRDGKVRIEVRSQANELELRVIDTGKGISPDFLPHVFDRFRQQEGTATRRYSGLGLGLALVRHLVMAHGGEVSAHSDGDDRGAIFSIRLPLADERNLKRPISDRPTPIPISASVDAIGQLVNVKVLVVEDDEDARDLLVTVLAQQGASVIGVGSAVEAQEKLAASCPDVLLSDIGLPAQDGYQLIRSVRERYSPERLPAVALTAYARREDELMALEAGFQAHVAKPVKPAELVRVVAEAGRGGLRT